MKDKHNNWKLFLMDEQIPTMFFLKQTITRSTSYTNFKGLQKDSPFK